MATMMKQFQANSYLFGGNAPYVEELYEAYLDNPGSVSDAWRAWFDSLQLTPASDGSPETRDVAHAPIVQSFATRARLGCLHPAIAAGDAETARKQAFVQQLMSAYRTLGAHWADLDPLKRQERLEISELEPSSYGLTETDHATLFSAAGAYFGFETVRLRDLLKALRDTYCGSVGAEFMHICDAKQKAWFQERLESVRARPSYDAERKRRILERLTAAEGLERYLHNKYVGQKRFSLEGSESFIAAMDELVQSAAATGIQEVVIGMAHRGRLNVLTNTLGKMPKDLFAEFEGQHADELPGGDVKYHKGFSSDVSTPTGPIHLSLAFNPSHLEIVNPVVEGSCRARMLRRGDVDGSQVLPLLVHGDAAFAGQGVVMETLNLSKTRGYGTHGTVHIVINNQIGFTTSDPRDSRSTIYCTDVAKMIEVPVLHVNGDDPEAVVFVTQLALEFRQKFRKDVVVDIVCFRRHGHNEQDTPAVTQPMMYKKVAAHPGTRKLYADKLILQKIVTEAEAQGMIDDYYEAMEAGKHTVDPLITDFKSRFTVDWVPFLHQQWIDEVDTSVPPTELRRVGELLTTLPSELKLHPLVQKVINDRRAMVREEVPIDWGMGEHLALGTLLVSGYGLRLSGQDSGRGTFTHRHAVLHDQSGDTWNPWRYIPLQSLVSDPSRCAIIDSLLSEEAVLAFEYGYASADPNTLVIWEAQFGDFANGAQVVIDQFISSGETKWGRACGLTLMLPHGYEGQGPEHSSARLERFLQLCAENNMQVCQPTTPAQIFHLLRRQMIRTLRKPLIILTPKSLLRHKEAVSSFDELAAGRFRLVIDGVPTASLQPQEAESAASEVKRIVFCSGRVYYDLLLSCRELGLKHIALVRIEQLYPFPHAALCEQLARYSGATEWVWCQDEPENQGAWFYLSPLLAGMLSQGKSLRYAGRPASASPAVGYYDKHYAQQKELVAAALT